MSFALNTEQAEIRSTVRGGSVSRTIGVFGEILDMSRDKIKNMRMRGVN